MSSFWIGQIWAPVDEYVTLTLRGIGETKIQSIYHSYAFLKFTTFEFIIILFSLYLLFTFKQYYQKDKFYKNFFILSIAVVIISLLNPNNNFEFRHYFGTQHVKKLHLYLLFLFSLTFLRSDILTIVLKKIFYIGAIVSFTKAIESLFFFMIGNGDVFMSRAVTISQNDTLVWMAIFNCIFMGLYFHSQEKKYLVISLIYFIVLLLSYRRYALFVAIIINLIGFLFYLKVKGKTKAIIKIFLLSFLIIFSFSIVSKSEIINEYINRYMGAMSYFIQFRDVGLISEFSDTGHMIQSIAVTNYVLDNIGRFWGTGLNSEYREYIPGQSSVIHNSFVEAWSLFGLYMVIFFMIISIIAFYKLNILWRSIDKYQQVHFFIKIYAAAIILVIMISGWFASPYHIFSFSEMSTQFILLMAVFKI